MKNSSGHARRRKVLLIAYHFPPSAAVGGIRAANFAKYLPESGWEPVVLTIGECDIESCDDTRRAAGELVVVRASKWPTILSAYRTAKQMIARRHRATAETTVGTIAPAAAAPADNRQSSLAARIRRLFLSLLYVPDGDRGWILPAIVRALWEIHTRKIRCIVTSCPPYTVHVVGLVVKLLTGVRWVADFRDPWMSGGRKALYVTSPLSLRLDRWLERRVVRNADMVVGNTPALRAALQRGYPEESPAKFATLTNSIDLGQFAPYRHVPKDSIFTITYAGALYFNRTPEPIFAAVRHLIDDHGIEPTTMRIRLIGNCDHVGPVPTVDLVRRYQLERVVEISPPVSYHEVLAAIRRSHVALVLAPTQPNQIPAKTYDYIGLGTEILALAPPGATAELVTRFAVGSAYDPGDVPGIVRYIGDALLRASTPAQPPSAAVRELDAQAMTPRLAAMLQDPAPAPEPFEGAPVAE
jgi:glycosyltransferase involved in cell wall biosynthesis